MSVEHHESVERERFHLVLTRIAVNGSNPAGAFDDAVEYVFPTCHSACDDDGVNLSAEHGGLCGYALGDVVDHGIDVEGGLGIVVFVDATFHLTHIVGAEQGCQARLSAYHLEQFLLGVFSAEAESNHTACGECACTFGTEWAFAVERVVHIDAFAVLMNLRASKLGCKGTHFVNACGLPDDNHYTTAYDLSLIMAAASELEDFKTLISAPSHVFVATNRHRADAWSYVKNSNYLLYDPWLASKTANGTDSHLGAVIGGKTGTTSQAGKGLTIYTVCENGHELMISICGIPQDYYFYTTMYLASVTAYGNLACWEADPVTRVYGTTGDYRWVNAPASQQPKYDPLVNPGDDLKDYGDALVTPTPVPDTETDPAENVPVEETLPPLQLFVKSNPVISGVIGGFMLLIMILNIVLMVRINRIKKAAAKRARRIEGKRIERK